MRSLLVDGGTDYGLRTLEQFAASATWRKSDLASDGDGERLHPRDACAPPGRAPSTASFGVRELDGAHGNLLPNHTAGVRRHGARRR